MKRYIPLSFIIITFLFFSNCGDGNSMQKEKAISTSNSNQTIPKQEHNSSSEDTHIPETQNIQQPDIEEKNSSKTQNSQENLHPKEAKKEQLFTRSPINDPLHPPSGSAVFSFRDAIIGEPILAVIEFSEDVADINQNSFEINGATVKNFDKVTPKLYRFVLMPQSSASVITLHLDKNLVIDKDGNSLKKDINAIASIAKAPWAQSIRRYRGTIEANLVYQNDNSKKMDIVFLWIRPGEFNMGCSGADEKHCQTNGTAHKVTLSKGFWLGRTEVTQWQWQVVMQNNPSFFNVNSEEEQKKLPVENINYNEAQEFTQKILQGYKAKATLPTEAQWEYAMRSTTTTAYYDNPDDIKGDANSKAAYYIGWYAGNSSEWNYRKVKQTPPTNGIDLSDRYTNFYTKPSSIFGTHYIMQKANSDWRLKDMAGNVAEWCSDWYIENLGEENQTNPTGPDSGEKRVVRGGSWYDPAIMLRSASREAVSPNTKSNRIGLRVAIYPGE
jgi:formylglycine-generating enzyme required for sulfatase activity